MSSNHRPDGSSQAPIKSDHMTAEWRVYCAGVMGLPVESFLIAGLSYLTNKAPEI